jgi:hypothetical protein
MKRILLVVAVLALVLLAYSQFRKARRLNAPNQFRYEIREDIDVNYYDPAAVSAYFESAAWLESWVRSMWYSRGIDVLTMDESNIESVQAVRKFNGRLAQARELEARLVASAQYKKEGLQNAQIRRIVEEGLSPEQVKQPEAAIRLGDRGPKVAELQTLLVKAGFEIPTDGNFMAITQNALMDFQRQQKLPVTGEADATTLAALRQWPNP